MQQFAGKASPEVWVISISDNQAKHLFLSLNPACIQPLTLLGLERLLDHCHLKTHFIKCLVARTSSPYLLDAAAATDEYAGWTLLEPENKIF